jgi:hypothetical protein
MRLVSDIMLGFEAKPHKRTVAVTLDLASAFNRVDHVHLLHLFRELSIPPVYGRFYKGFLEDRIFRVRCGHTYSKWKKESCGSPQGTVSSPVLFIIYMEGFLRTCLPAADSRRINMALFADDLTLWKTGSDIQQMANDITTLINNYIDPWATSHNMILKQPKCHSFLFSQYYRDPKPLVSLHDQVLSYGSNDDHTFLRLLGVRFDSRMTFKYQLEHMTKQAGLRLQQLSRVSNSIYGLEQTDLITMYIAYIRSVLEYAAPVWYPCMSTTSLAKLQRIQNHGLRIALGVPRSTRIDSLHYEAAVVPLQVRYDVATAYQAEKYRRHPQTDPIFETAHRALPPSRLKRSNWQYRSDQVLEEAGFYPARLDVHQRCPPNLCSLASRRPIAFIPDIPPWRTEESYRVSISPSIPGIFKHDPPEYKLALAEETLTGKRKHFDFSFWTDGSYTPDAYGTAACISFETNGHPCKRRRMDNETTIMARPAGLAGASCLPEKIALDLPAEIIRRNPRQYRNSNIFVGCDSQSSLMALNAGPLRDLRHSPTGYNWSHTYKSYVDIANELHSTIHLQWLPAHVGIAPNEEVDDVARDYSERFPASVQNQQPIELKALKSTLKRRLKQKWMRGAPLRGARFNVCGIQQSQLKKRHSVPRALQTLYSRWRVGEVESCGVYPRRLQWIADPQCRFCGYPCETTVHLLSTCPDTAAYRLTHGISFDTLVDETPENIMRIAHFDAFIRRVLGCTHYRCNESLKAILYEHERKRKMVSPDSTKQNRPQTTTHKRRRLIIRHAGLKHSCMQQNTVDKKRRQSRQ